MGVPGWRAIVDWNVQPLFQPLTDAGFAWFSISYRLATDISQFGAAVSDVREAIRFVKSHAADYHIDPEKIALIGESAGGQLAEMAVLRGGPDTSVKAVVALYTPSDLVSPRQKIRHTFRHRSATPSAERRGRGLS